MLVRVAVEGCCHGELNKIYATLPAVDLLLICGDFQAIRNKSDLQTLNVPPKYLKMGDFHQYYLGEREAPVLTIFIGGNHECLLYMRELQFGGWVAPNIYYLGEYGVLWYKGLRISGTSGIWNPRTFGEASRGKGLPTYQLPYNSSTIRSIYHVKPKNYLKLLMSGTSDVVLSHDWPQNIWDWGNKAKLLKSKPFFKSDIETGELGSPLARNVLHHLKPRYWFSLHLHCRFTARVEHKLENSEVKESKTEKSREISLDMDCVEPSVVEEKKVDSNKIELDMDEEVKVESSKDNEIRLDMDQETKQYVDEEIKLDLDEEIKLDMDEEIKLEMDEEIKRDIEIPPAKTSRSPSPSPSKKRKTQPPQITEFLALDKCLPKRKFLEVITVQPRRKSEKLKGLHYDARSIATHKVVERFIQSNPLQWYSIGQRSFLDLDKLAILMEELDEAITFEEKKLQGADLAVPRNFRKIAPDSTFPELGLQYWENNQTSEFCKRFGIPEPDLEEW